MTQGSREIIRLPDKMSDLIEVALRDLARVEAQPKLYQIDMGAYHEPIGERCWVCFAGVVIAGTLGADWRRSTSPQKFDDDTKHKLYALDMLRRGSPFIRQAFTEMEVPVDGVQDLFDHQITRYWANPRLFRHDMTVLAMKLRERGL